jgi:DNA-binding winged helix-turn-helix (wHTH) protein/TolB-like protein
MSEPASQYYEFGPFRLDPFKRLLVKDGQAVALTSKAFDMLLALVESRGRVLEKDELLERVWPGTVVEEKNLTVNISTLRKALGETPNEHSYIVTVPGRGYRFVANVREVAGEPDPVIEEKERKKAARDEEPPEVLAARRNVRRFALVLCMLALVILVSYLWDSSRTKSVDTTATARQVAVLPFRSLGADTDEYLGLGMADALITKLSNIREITVRPTSAVARYAGVEKEKAAAGRELGVDAVLDGHVQVLGDRIRVTVQLVSTRDGRPVWAEKFDEKFTDIFKVQDSISEHVAEALIPWLTGEQKRLLAKRYTNNAEAYQSYLKGRYFWSRRSEQDLSKAIGFFEQAIKEDPGYGLGYVGLADSYSILGWYGRIEPSAAYPRAKQAAARALEIDDALGEAHASMGLIHANYDWSWAGAEAEYKRAIALNAGYTAVHQWYGQLLAMLGRHDEAIAELERAREIDPVSPAGDAFTGQVLYFAGRHDQALERGGKAVEIDPDFFFTHLIMGWAYEQKKQYREAATEFEKARRADDFSLIQASLGYTYGVSGRRAEAIAVLDELKEIAARRYVSPYHFALVYAGLGEKEKALEMLEKAYADRSVLMQWLKVDPKLDSLRSDQRFQSLLLRMGFSG